MEKFNFVIKGKQYETDPITVGHMVDLWKMRTSLSMGTYGQMYRFALHGSDSALLAIDIEAFFTVFCPKFLEDLKPASISNMGIHDYIELEQFYTESIRPWLDSIESLLRKKSE